MKTLSVPSFKCLIIVLPLPWPSYLQACDRGDEYDRLPDSPRLCSNATYTVQVLPVNYMAPKIEFPGDDERIRLK